MAELDQNRSVTWAIGTGDNDLDADMQELNNHPELIERYGKLLLDLSGVVGETVRENGLEGLTFFTKAFKIIVTSSVKVLRANRKHGNKK